MARTLVFMLRRLLLWLRRRENPEQLFFAILCLLALLLFVRIKWRPSMDWVVQDVAVFEDVNNHVGYLGKELEKHERWVIVTTIQEPTRALKSIAQIPGWKVLVVGDSKTPVSWDIPGVIYLDLQKQEKLGYHIVSVLPFESYTRKLIGYLYAIQRGAHFIYDTDDDNLPWDNLQTFQYRTPVDMVMADTHELVFNSYAHFGQSSIWPRGYPIEYFTNSSWRQRYKLCEIKVPAVQQGLVNGDPDVDSFFRMSRKYPSSNLNVEFDSKTPPVAVPRGTFVPFNSQNTLFAYKAFWGLVIPVTTTFRTCDIYRGYWTQKLLWMLGEHVGIYPPNVFHQRNDHSYIDDALQETDFIRMGKLLSLLKKWECSRLHFFSCASDLAKEMVHWGFWRPEDIELIDAWFTDLSALGYVPPAIKEKDYHVCHERHDDTMLFTYYPNPQPAPLPHSESNFIPATNANQKAITSFVESVCPGQKSAVPFIPPSDRDPKFQDILLVINLEGNGESIAVLETWYRNAFPNILYCGKREQVSHLTIDKWGVSYAALNQNQAAHISCISTAIRLGYNVTGYLFLPENTLADITSLNKHSQTQLWLTQDWMADEPKLRDACANDKLHCQQFTKSKLQGLAESLSQLDVGTKIKAKLKKCFDKIALDPSMQSGNGAYYLRDIVFYIPARLRNIFLQLARLYNSNKHDTLTILLMECLEIAPEYLTYTDILTSYGMAAADYVFPYYADSVLRKGASNIKQFCQYAAK